MEVSGNFGSISRLIPPSGKALKGINARERAYWIIRDKIIYMDLKPGEPLSDKILAEQLEMSRTPVREALILLSAYNMVVMKPQIGTFVTPIDYDWVTMEQFSRLTMEKEIIRQVCAKDTSRLYSEYEMNIRRFAEVERSKDPDRIRHLHELDNNFHGLAFREADKINSFFHMHSYMQHVERLRVLTLSLETDKHIYGDHAAIAEAVKQQDTRTALQCLENHLSIYKDSVELAKAKHPEYFILG